MRWLLPATLALTSILPLPAHATFSIVACTTDGSCGAAVATNNLAVGATVIHAQAGVGAIASQFETHPHHGPRGLALLARGQDAPAVLRELLAQDGDFDGQDTSWRQLGVVAAKGEGAAFTGQQALASRWAGAATGAGFSVQGNGLAGAQVLEAMRQAFVGTDAPLPQRLMAALEAGAAAGGQATGALSAALLVRTREGAWQDVDLRVDASAHPVKDLRRLLNLRLAHDAVLLAERLHRAGQGEAAQRASADAMRLGGEWDRICRRVARLNMAMGRPEEAVRAFAAFRALNPVWAEKEAGDALYAAVRDEAVFRFP